MGFAARGRAWWGGALHRWCASLPACLLALAGLALLLPGAARAEAVLRVLKENGKKLEYAVESYPLKFSDGKSYKDRLNAARKAAGRKDTMAIGYGSVGGQDAVVIVQDFTFMGGSLGMAAGEAFIKAAREAVARQVPLICFTAAGGARMQEGALSLMQMARTTLAVEEVKDAKLPYAVVLTDPTTGGVTASYAMLGDVHLAEPGALIGFAGPRVIEATIREKLPPGFQRAEYLQEKGMVDRVVSRADLPRMLGQILSMLMGGKRQAA